MAHSGPQTRDRYYRTLPPPYNCGVGSREGLSQAQGDLILPPPTPLLRPPTSGALVPLLGGSQGISWAAQSCVPQLMHEQNSGLGAILRPQALRCTT